jgi:hypothetical protein
MERLLPDLNVESDKKDNVPIFLLGMNLRTHGEDENADDFKTAKAELLRGYNSKPFRIFTKDILESNAKFFDFDSGKRLNADKIGRLIVDYRKDPQTNIWQIVHEFEITRKVKVKVGEEEAVLEKGHIIRTHSSYQYNKEQLYELIEGEGKFKIIAEFLDDNDSPHSIMLLIRRRLPSDDEDSEHSED